MRRYAEDAGALPCEAGEWHHPQGGGGGGNIGND